MRATQAIFLLLVPCLAQTPAFEAASLKASNRPARTNGVVRGGPGTADPGQMSYLNMSLRALILRAYGIQEYQITGPAWMAEARYDVIAKLSAGATKADAAAMLRQLLAERFHLAAHRETKDLAGYALTVGTGGPKFKESTPIANPPAAPATDRRWDQDGYPELTPGIPEARIDSASFGGAHVLAAALQTMSDLAVTAAREIGKPVLDATGLTGKYDYRLHWETDRIVDGQPPVPATGPDFAAALGEQLGLRLEARKVPTEMVVVDHAEKAATDN